MMLPQRFYIKLQLLKVHIYLFIYLFIYVLMRLLITSM